MESLHEPARSTTVSADCDVLVAGGGPAGICAALAAARGGARTILLEGQGCLGGIWTSGLLSWILDHHGKGGILDGILRTLRGRGLAQAPTLPAESGGMACDAEAMKLLLEELAVAAGVRVRLHTRVVAALRDGSRIVAAITESRSGREAWTARQFIDCTGDGELAARAGCAFDLGRPGDGACQPLSQICLLAGVRCADIADCVHGDPNPWGSDSDRLTALLATRGVRPSYGKPILVRIRDDLLMMMANHQYGVRCDDADGITAATLEARAEDNRIVDALRSLGGAWSGLRLVATGAHIGVREGRRIRGRYQVSASDLAGGARHADAVVRCRFGVDVHALSKHGDRGFERTGVKSRPYDIPLRALIADGLDNLLMGGRCISGDFIAHSSYRVTGDAAALGQAAGAGAALAAARGCPAHELPWPDVDAALRQLGWTPPA